MATRILVRGDTAADWTSANPVLSLREEGVETDTHRRKIGDGVTPWTGLPYSTALPADVTAAQTAAEAYADGKFVPTAGLDAANAAVVTPGGSQTAAALAADAEFKAAYVARTQDVLNILAPAFGVSTGTTTSQTTAILAALAANPGKAFYFPDGDYRCDTTLAITTNNSLILAHGARIYAGAAMDTLINYDNGQTVSNYAQDKFLVGTGTIDGNLLASKALAIGSVLRFTLGEGLTIKDSINRGLFTKAAGAELICHNLRLMNSGTTNVTDNVAIENNMGDGQFSQVISRDFTTGAIDAGSASWSDFHPWLGTTDQLTARYPTSVGFINKAKSILARYYADTYRYDYRSAADTGYAVGKMTDFKSYTNTTNLTDALAAANTGAILDLVDGGFLNIKGLSYSGDGTTPRAFVQGNTARLTVSESTTTTGGVTGVADYRRGVRISDPIPNTTPFTRGTWTSFTPTLAGSTTPGTGTYTVQSGRMEVRDGLVHYRFQVKGSLAADAVGNLRIGGLPVPPGAVSVGVGWGSLDYVSGANVQTLIGANGTTGPLLATVIQRSTSSSAEIAVPTSTTLELWGQITCPFTYPS